MDFILDHFREVEGEGIFGLRYERYKLIGI